MKGCCRAMHLIIGVTCHYPGNGLLSETAHRKVCPPSTLPVGDEDGNQDCIPFSEELWYPKNFNATAVSGAEISPQQCFIDYCKSDEVRQMLVKWCNDVNFGPTCNRLYYGTTYFDNLDANQKTYSYSGATLEYDSQNMVEDPISKVVWDMIEENEASVVAERDISHSFTVKSGFSWTAERDVTFSNEISSEVEVEIPSVAKVKTGIKETFTVGTKNSNSQTKEFDQNYEVTDKWQIQQGTCGTYCIVEDDDKFKVPYNIIGDFTSTGYGIDGSAFTCCWLRPGGNNRGCNWAGHMKVAAGWATGASAAQAVRWGAARGKCPNLSPRGEAAHFELPGVWEGGFKISSKVQIHETPVGQCRDCAGNPASAPPSLI